ncbi:MAG: hypothetical protein E7485_08345 [Ruminococcaceae bacterium]|nr:hypothetical protein [Oscillospiraceae bacterium]
MNCNVKDSLKRQICAEIAETLDEQRIVWELLTIVVLHDEFGLGQERLERYGRAMQKMYNEFTNESRLTDNPHRRGEKKMSNIDTAVIRILRALKSNKIDYHPILDIVDMKIDGVSMDDMLEKMEGT